MEKIYARPTGLLNTSNPYCPGCSHPTISKIIAEVLDEMGLRDNALIVYAIGCTTLSQVMFTFNMASALHGRAPSLATGYKRIRPDQPVILIQGDGDAIAIGASETINTASRGEPLTVIVVNNQIFGMTGGQMSPTTLTGQASTTSPNGRDPSVTGYPVRMAEMIAILDAPRYVTRCGVFAPKYTIKAKKAIQKGLEIQINEKGYSYIELISACPVNWHMEPVDTMRYIEESVLPVYPLGDLKTK